MRRCRSCRHDHNPARPHGRPRAHPGGARRPPGRRRGRPGLRRGAGPRPLGAAARPLPPGGVPAARPHHHRRQRQHRRHAGRSPGASPRELPRVRAVRLDAQGPRPGAARRLGDERRRGARVHGRRPLHRPRRACCRWWPRWCRGHSDVAIGSGCARGARSSAGRSGSSSPAATTCCCGRRCGRASRDAQCGFKAVRADAARELLPLVRGRRRGSSTPSCWCSPSAPACASTRCRWTGSTTPTAGWTSSRTALDDLRAWQARALPDRPGCRGRHWPTLGRRHRRGRQLGASP